MQIVESSAGPVPLYLIPQALSAEIHRFRDSITEIHVRRTSGHNYAIQVLHEDQDGGSHVE